MSLTSTTHHEKSVLPAAVPQQSQKAGPCSTASALRDAFRASPYVGLRRVECDDHEGVLTLRGRVPTFFLKQMAQALAMKAKGVEVLANRIEVQITPALKGPKS